MRAYKGTDTTNYAPFVSGRSSLENPEGFALGTIASTSITLNWTAESVAGTSVSIERSDDGGATFSEIATATNAASSYTSSGYQKIRHNFIVCGMME